MLRQGRRNGHIGEPVAIQTVSAWVLAGGPGCTDQVNLMGIAYHTSVVSDDLLRRLDMCFQVGSKETGEIRKSHVSVGTTTALISRVFPVLLTAEILNLATECTGT